MVAFILFAVSNAIPMYTSQESLVLIHEEIQRKEIFSSSHPLKVLFVPLVFDAILVAFLLPTSANSKKDN